MVEENIRQEFRLKNIEETRNYFTKEIDQNELTSKKNKKVCTTLNYIEHFLILASTDCMYFSFCFSFYTWYFYRNYDLCNRVKSLRNNCSN